MTENYSQQLSLNVVLLAFYWKLNYTKMSEDILKHLSINAVMGLFVQSMKELSIARNINDETEIRVKTKEVELLKSFLVAKRAEFSPGYFI